MLNIMCNFVDMEELKNIGRSDFKRWDNGKDILSYKSIEEFKRKDICCEHNLPYNTEIYYYRKYDSKDTYVVCDLGISFFDDNHKHVLLTWEQIECVEYNKESGYFHIYYDFRSSTNYWRFYSYRFIKTYDCEPMSHLINRMANLVVNKIAQQESSFTMLHKKGEWSKIIQLGKSTIDNSEYADMLPKVYRWMGMAYDKISEQEGLSEETIFTYRTLALEYVDKALQHIKNDDDLLFLKAKLHVDFNQLYAARRLYIQLMASNRSDIALPSYDKYSSITQLQLKKNFADTVNEDHRKFLMFVKSNNSIAGCNDEDDNIQYVFALDAYPKDLVFPMGHPQANTLYMKHPMLHNHYLPCDNIEEILFIEKIRDFCYLVQCLGATRISFKVLKGQTVNVDSQSSVDVSVGAGRKSVNIDGSVNTQNKELFNNTRNSGTEWEYTYDPIALPFCPNDSVWLKSDVSWQQMVKMRLQGNQLSYVERITSKETLNMSSSQQVDVAASFNSLLFKASAKVSTKSEQVVFTSEEREYEINVTFKSIEEYKNRAEQNVITNEERYKNEVLFCMETEGVIGSDERMFLECKRVRWGIDKAKAEQLENMCHSILKQAETEYVEMFKTLCADGQITNSKLRLLNHERELLGISLQRAEQLERGVK